MHGLTIRWSLQGAPEGTVEALRAYVLEQSAPRFAAMPELHSKVWQVVDRGFFAGSYVWETAESRAEFLRRFRAEPSAVTQIVGTEPESVQEWDVVAVIESGRPR